MEYDKASPKLKEKLLKGEVIPKLEIEFTATFGDAGRQTYLKWELVNVQITDYSFSGSGNDESPPVVVVGNNFEEIKVTYTEFDEAGNTKGNVETTFKIEKGEK